MKKRTVFIVGILFFFSELLSAQIMSGLLTITRVDSIYPYNITKVGATDTIIAFIDGEAAVYVVDHQNSHMPYEYNREKAVFYFTDEWAISKNLNSNLYRLFNFKTKISQNVVRENGRYKSVVRFKMYDDYSPNTYATPLQVPTDKDSCATLDSLNSERYHYLTLDKTSGAQVGSVDICIAPQIQIPTNLFTQYPEMTNACPIQYKIHESNRIISMRLDSFEKLEKEKIIQQIDQELFKLLFE